MKLGIIGAGLIVRTLLQFIHEIDEVKLVAIAATKNSQEKLLQLKQEHGFKYIYTDVDEMLKNDEIDVIYLAVNNHMHYLIAKKVLQAKKHLIMEKPFTSNYDQAKALIDLANKNHLFVFEAISAIYNPNHLKIKELLPTLGDIKIVNVNYTQYSSRYDAFLNGEILPAFDYTKSGGALMDLNIYNIHFIVDLFGAPKNVSYIANIEHNIDTSGILTMEYDGFKVCSIAAKDCGAPLLNCIQGNKGCIYTSSPIFTLTHFEHQLNKQDPVHYDLTNNVHRMKHEFEYFLKIYNNNNYEEDEKIKNHILTVMDVLTKARKSIQLEFPDDLNI